MLARRRSPVARSGCVKPPAGRLRINPRNGLYDALILNEGTGAPSWLRASAEAGITPTVGANTAWGVNAKGPLLQDTSGTPNISVTTTGVPLDTELANWRFTVIASIARAGSGGVAVLQYREPGGSTFGWNVGYSDWDSSNVLFNVGQSWSGNFFATGQQAFARNGTAPTTVAWVVNGATAWRCLTDGVFRATGSAISSTEVPTTLPTLTVGPSGSLATVEWILLFNRPLSDAEVAFYSQEPFADIEPFDGVAPVRPLISSAAAAVALTARAIQRGTARAALALTKPLAARAKARGTLRAAALLSLKAKTSARGTLKPAPTLPLKAKATARGAARAPVSVTRNLAGKVSGRGTGRAALAIARILSARLSTRGAGRSAMSLSRFLSARVKGARGTMTGVTGAILALAARLRSRGTMRPAAALTRNVSARVSTGGKGRGALALTRVLAGKITSRGAGKGAVAITRKIAGKLAGRLYRLAAVVGGAPRGARVTAADTARRTATASDTAKRTASGTDSGNGTTINLGDDV